MRFGISGAPVPSFVPFFDEITIACAGYPDGGFPPCFLAAIKWNETGNSRDPAQLQDGADPATGLMPDGSPAGRGPFQLTASYPPDWMDPQVNAIYALTVFLAPSVRFFLEREPTLSGDALIKCAAAGYNAGPEAAWKAHVAGNVDAATTNNYGARAVAAYHALLNGVTP